MKRKRTIALGLIVLLIWMLTGCTSNNPDVETDESLAQQEKKVIVETDKVKQGNLYSEKGILAQVVSTQEVEVYANIGGRVIEIAAREGAIIEKGQVIARLDSEEQKMAISQANDALEQAKTQEESARRSYEKSLLSAKELAGMELQQADMGIEQVKTTLVQAQQALKQAEKAAEHAKTKLNESAIRAPFTGIVSNVHVKEGGYAAPYAPIVEMFNNQQLKVITAIYPSQKNDFVKGQKVKIIGVNGKVSHDGEIVHSAPYVDDKGFIQIEASILGDSKNFIVGEYAELLVETVIDENQLLVPTKAISEKDGKAFVYSHTRRQSSLSGSRSLTHARGVDFCERKASTWGRDCCERHGATV